MIQKMEGLGSATTRAEASETARKSSLASEYSAATLRSSTTLFCSDGPSVERLAFLREGRP